MAAVLLFASLCLLLSWSSQAPRAALASPVRGSAKGTQVDISIATPAFIASVPFAISDGPNSVSGTVTVYFRATRSVKQIGSPGQVYYAYIAATTFMFAFNYKSSTGLGSDVHLAQDVLYLDRISAVIYSTQVTDRLASG
ncbi:hypothetical protein GQ54DRAFT_298561 [Martensiomyces pterosporus]|nr:hypothetical protein GQ54DRAFT_298561 [Martensiomyces pterosporus]